jgi:hypothetical protein
VEFAEHILRNNRESKNNAYMTNKNFDQKIQQLKPGVYQSIENARKAIKTEKCSSEYNDTVKTVFEILDWVKNCLDGDDYSKASELDFPDSKIVEDLPEKIVNVFQDVKFKFLVLVEVYNASKRNYTFDQATEKVEQIKKGMKKKEVLKILGKPDVNNNLDPEYTEWKYSFKELVKSPGNNQKKSRGKLFKSVMLEFNGEKLYWISKEY